MLRNVSCGDNRTMPFVTVRRTSGDTPTFPAPSRAAAARVWAPSDSEVESQLRVYGADVSSAPTDAPSTRNRTPATPTLSVALAATGTVPETDPADGDVMMTEG